MVRRQNAMSKRQRSSKRGQGEGSIYKRKDGRWTSVLNLGYEDGKLKRKYFYGKTRKEVCDKLTESLRNVQQGIPAVTGRQTFKEFLELWLNDCVKSKV